MESKIKKTKKNLKVANFNSPHTFKFDDGTELEAVSPNFATETMLRSEDVEYQKNGFTAVEKIFKMSEPCRNALTELRNSGKADIIIVPFPVLMAAKAEENFSADGLYTVFLTDRVNKICSATKFCI